MYSEDYRYIGNELKLVPVGKYTAWARWSEKEKQLIIVLYVKQKKSMKEIASILKRPVRSVESQLRRLGCLKTPDWSSDDERYLIENHEKLSNEQLSVILKKSKNAIAIKKHRLCSK